MVKRTNIRSRKRRALRACSRRAGRAVVRNLFSLGTDDLPQALAAFRHAIRAHRKLARLAPEFFDSTVVNRLARKRIADAKWMASWEPALNKVYGPSSEPPYNPLTEQTPLPRSSRTRRAVEREFAAWELYMQIGKSALARHRQRRPHALVPFGRIVRLLEIGMDFGRLVCGEPDPASESYNHDQALRDLERIYGRDHEEPSTAPNPSETPAAQPATPPPSLATAAPPAPALPPADTKKDFTLCALTIGPHGFLCLQPLE